MEDNKFIYYLILGAIYLISRAFKKKTPPNPIPKQPASFDQEEYETPKPRPSSFEELLKEISSEYNKEPSLPEHTIAYEEPEPKIIAPAKRELSREELYVKKRHAEKKIADELKMKLSLSEQDQEHDAHQALELLREEGGAANAVVLSEILNRRF